MTRATLADGRGTGRIIAGVIRSFLATSGRTGLHLIGGGPGERALANVWLSGLVNDGGDDPGGLDTRDGAGWRAEEEERFRARIAAHEKNGEVAHLANRTYLILARRLPPERVLPLGDLAASEVLALGGRPLLPPPFHAVADDPSALVELESAIDAWLAGSPAGDSAWGPVVAAPTDRTLGEVLKEGFLVRAQDRIVPKLGHATPWIDLDM